MFDYVSFIMAISDFSMMRMYFDETSVLQILQMLENSRILPLKRKEKQIDKEIKPRVYI